MAIYVKDSGGEWKELGLKTTISFEQGDDPGAGDLDRLIEEKINEKLESSDLLGESVEEKIKKQVEEQTKDLEDKCKKYTDEKHDSLKTDLTAKDTALENEISKLRDQLNGNNHISLADSEDNAGSTASEDSEG